MGLGSFLKKWALPIAGIAATPFTGGASLLTTLGMGAKTAGLIGAGIGAAGKLAGGASQQRAQDRGAQAEHDLVRQQLEQQRIAQGNSQALDYANARRGAESDRMKQLGSVDMLSSLKEPTDPRARFGNGGRMSPEHLAMIRERAMNALNSGSDVPQLQQAGVTPTMPKGTGTDSFLNALSMGGTALGALKESGVFNRPNDGGQAASMRAPADLEASIFSEEGEPWWSPLRRGN